MKAKYVRWHQTKRVDERDDEETNAKTRVHVPYDIVLKIVLILDEERSSHYAPYHVTRTVLQPTLFAVCLLNKTCYAAAFETLYKDVVISSSENLEVFLRALEKRKCLRPCVRSFSFSCPRTGDDHAYVFKNERNLIRIYSVCPKIQARAVSTSMFPFLTTARRQRSYFRQFQKIDAESVTKLYLQPSGNNPQVFPSNLNFPALETLVVSKYRSVLWKSPKLEWPSMPRLRELCLRYCVYDGVFLSLPPSKLRRLDIFGVQYGIIGMWTELAEVRETLEYLTFAPTWREPWDLPVMLTSFPSVVTLCISTKYFVTTSESRYPRYFPRLVHLIVVEVPPRASSNPNVSFVLQQIKHVVEAIVLRRNSNQQAYLYLESITLIAEIKGKASNEQGEVHKVADSAGIKFSVLNTASKLPFMTRLTAEPPLPYL